MTWDLHADADAIGASSPNIRAFAEHVADILQPVTPPAPTSGALYFAADSPWNTPIGPSPVIVPQSAQWMQALYNDSPGGIGVNTQFYSPVVQYADASTPRKTWTATVGGWKMDDVPTPANMVRAPEPEHYNAVVDTARGRVYSFLDADPSTLRYEYGGVFRLNGSGWWSGEPWIGSAAGACYLAGTILKHDVAAGGIPHALYMTVPKNASAGHVNPATTSDGNGVVGAVMPEGSRLQLNPAFDYTTLGISRGDLLCETLRVFGAIPSDSQGPNTSCGFLAENWKYPSSSAASPYPAWWSTDAGAKLRRELIPHMRVVAPPAHAPVYDDRTVFGQPHA